VACADSLSNSAQSRVAPFTWGASMRLAGRRVPDRGRVIDRPAVHVIDEPSASASFQDGMGLWLAGGGRMARSVPPWHHVDREL
jgi:hypothetical protein